MDPAPQPPGVVADTPSAEARFLATQTDVAREQAEQALRENEERFRQMAEHIQQVFWPNARRCRSQNALSQR